MIRALWLKKIWRGRSKGVSSVIGTVFLILVVFAIATNVFLWTISQSSVYNQAAKDVNQNNADSMNENLIATEGNYTVISGGRVKVEAKLTNAGSVAVHIVNLWVFDTAKQTYGFNNSIASIGALNLNPGQIANLRGTDAIIVPVPDADAGDDFNAWFVTERGNTVSIAALEQEVEPGTGGELSVGPFLLEFSNEAFQHTSDVNPTSPEPAFQIDNDRKKILFWVKVKNLAGRGIQISQLSFFLVEVRELTSQGVPGTMEYERYFHIVEPASTSSALVAYSPDYMQTIPSRQSVILKFGASTVGGTFFESGPDGEPLHGSSADDGWSNLLWTFLVIFWRYEPTVGDPSPPTFGQTITYAAIHSAP